MTQVNNSEVIQELIRSAKLQAGKDRIPNFLSSGIVPTIELSSKLVKNADIVRDTVASNSTGATIYTTPTNMDFYLTGMTLSVIKDVTATSTFSDILIQINGRQVRPLRIDTLTLTVEIREQSIVFTHPIKVDRGFAIQVENTTATGNIKASATIIGFLDEASNG